jgi:hypothetical protein
MPSDIATDELACIAIGSHLILDEFWHIRVVSVRSERPQRVHLLTGDTWGESEFVMLVCSSLMCHKNLTPNPTKQQLSATKREDKSWADQSGAWRMGWVCYKGRSELYKSCNKSFLFRGFIWHNNPRMTRQPVFGTTSTLGEFGVRGRSESGEMAFDLQFTFIDTSRVRDGSIPRYQATLDFGPRKRSNPISDIHRATDTFMSRVWGF